MTPDADVVNITPVGFTSHKISGTHFTIGRPDTQGQHFQKSSPQWIQIHDHRFDRDA